MLCINICMFLLIVRPELQLIRKYFPWGSNPSILACKWKVRPDIVEWELSGEWDTHSSKAPLRRNYFFPLEEKMPSLPYEWTVKLEEHTLTSPLVAQVSGVEGELAGKAEVKGTKVVHAWFRNLYGQWVGPHSHWFWLKADTKFK